MPGTKPKFFYIHLNSNSKTYLPGNPITGYVDFEILKPKRSRFVNIQFTGIVYTGWSETHYYYDANGQQHSNTVYYSSSFTVINQAVNLWSPSSETDMLLPGRYTLPFSFTIPANSLVPPSFEGAYGYVRYYFTAVIDRPGLHFSHRTYMPITVIDLFDTNKPEYLREMAVQNSKTMCCCCCKSDPIFIIIRIPAVAWCPGEVLPIKVTVDNGSDKQMRGIIGAIDSYATFKAEGHSRTSSGVVAFIKNEETIAPKTKVSKMLYLRVPPCCPSFDYNIGRIINLSYYVRATLILPPRSFNLDAYIPINIGTIPHMKAPMFREMEASAAEAQESYTWCTPEGIGAAVRGPQDAQAIAPDTLPTPPDFVEFEGKEGEVPQNMGGEVNYLYFPMPNKYSGHTKDCEEIPLEEFGNMSSSQNSNTNFSASTDGFTGNIFSAPSVLTPIQK